MIYFTSSWDDGSPFDIKLSELLLKYDQKATFFIPLANVEKRPVINSNQIAELSKYFEIGAHTLNHKYLTCISNEEAEYEIKQSKKELESIIRQPVHGFCFPGGKYKPIHLEYVNQAGFEYARTVNMFKYGDNTKIMNTTLHAYNHSKYTYFKHLIKRGYLIELFENSISIIKSKGWDVLLDDFLKRRFNNYPIEKIIIIHLWGHSWEIQEKNTWQQLENFLKRLKEYEILSKTNFEISQLKNTIQF